MTTKVNQTELFKTAFREMMKSVNTGIPGHILSFDKDTQLAQVQIGIEQLDVSGKTFEPAPLIEVPVYVYGGAFSVECQINDGTEGLIIFSQRCIDGWNDTGGVAKNPIIRFHDSSDAFFLPGMRSQPNTLPSFENDGIRIRNEDGTKHVWLKNNGDVEISANNVNIISTTLTHNGVDISSVHSHIGPDTAPDGPISPTGVPI